MAKAAKKHGRPRGRRPVIAARVSEDLFKEIQTEAKRTGQTMSGLIAATWERVRSYEKALGDSEEFRRKHAADLAEMEKGNVRGVLGRKGWRIGPDGTWIDPDSDYGKALPKSRFLTEEEAASFHAPEQPALLSAKSKEAFGQLLAPLEQRLASLEATLAKARLVVLEGDAEQRKRA